MPTAIQLRMVAPGIQTIGAIDMAYCKLCIPCLRRIGIRLADPLQTFVACIPFATTVATGSGFRKLIRCPAGRHLGTGIRTSNSEEYADASSTDISTSYGHPAAATGFRTLRCAAGRHLGTGIQSNCPRSSSEGSTVRAIIETIYGCAAAATGFRKLRCAAGRHLGTGIRTSSSEES